MPRKRQLTRDDAERLGRRERDVGIEPDDAAARWLAAQDPAPPAEAPKSRFKSKVLHQWRQRQQQNQTKR